ncbi:MAG: transglycosylase family protein [Nocardioidaceae bacterium]
MNTSVPQSDGRYRRSVRILSSALTVGALVAGTMAATTTSADAAKNRTWDRLAQCESGGRWHINSTYDGGLQFSPSTWRAYGGAKFAPYAYQAKRWEQIAIAERALRGQGWGAWPACSAELGLDYADAKARWEGRPDQEIKKLFRHDGAGSRQGLHRMKRTHRRTVGIEKSLSAMWG